MEGYQQKNQVWNGIRNGDRGRMKKNSNVGDFVPVVWALAQEEKLYKSPRLMITML